jgi:2,4-dienoyl-CoA reductase-like NADH-dependent reductase (Old Yellow Enzyme family)
LGLFDTGLIGNLELPNRFIRSATAEFAADEDGCVTSGYFPLYSNLAKGEVGLIIQGHLYILDEGKAHKGMAGISNDNHLTGLKQIIREVHAAGTGSTVAAQLNHGGAHSVSTKAPSAREGKTLQVMTDADIENVITGFREAATRAKKAGYDAIQIHAAHGYLVRQFYSSKTNQRTDSWGGSLENRAQFLLSVYQAIRSAVGSNFPVFAKINGSDDPIGGFSVEESTQVIAWLADEGLDAIEISGMQSSRKLKREDEGYFEATARAIKQSIGDLPLSVVGGIRTASMMKKFQEEFADFISICRPFIREPDLVRKLREGKEKVDCISCNRCYEARNVFTCQVKKDNK